MCINIHFDHIFFWLIFNFFSLLLNNRFDGDFINFKETAEDLDLEGGEMMDFFQQKST